MHKNLVTMLPELLACHHGRVRPGLLLLAATGALLAVEFRIGCLAIEPILVSPPFGPLRRPSINSGNYCTVFEQLKTQQWLTSTI